MVEAVAPARAQGLAAAADETALWVLSPEVDQPEAFNVLHYAYSDTPMLFEHVQTLRGVVGPNTVGAQDHTLWIIYPDGEVQTIRAVPSPLEDEWQYRAHVEPSMPKGVHVRALVLTHEGPWVLVRVDDAKTLQALDAQGEKEVQSVSRDSAKRLRNIAIGLPPDYGSDNPKDDSAETPGDSQSETDKPKGDASAGDAQTEPTPEATPEAAPETTKEPASDEGAVEQGGSTDAASGLPVDRLLQLKHGVWKNRALPEDWPHGAEAWLVAENAQAVSPTLVALSSRSRSRVPVSVDVYHLVGEENRAWESQTYLLGSSAEVGGLAFVGAEGQLLASRTHVDSGRVDAELSVLRNGKVLSAGTLSLDDVSPTRWSLLGTGTTAALLAQLPVDAGEASGDAERLRFRLTRMDVRGSTILEPTDIGLKTRSVMDDLTQYIMLAFIAVLVTVLMLAFWRRDASWNRLELPADLMVADLGRRVFAASVDMAPGLIGSMVWFGMSSQELLLHWPGNGIAHTFEQVLPGAVVIGVFVGHTTISELIFSRTLGKALTGLRTTALNGAPPKAWQLLVRGLLKALDLIPGAWLLLMLPLIAPHRQRLGDLVGRTVVVCDAPPKSGDHGTDEEK